MIQEADLNKQDIGEKHSVSNISLSPSGNTLIL